MAKRKYYIFSTVIVIIFSTVVYRILNAQESSLLVSKGGGKQGVVCIDNDDFWKETSANYVLKKLVRRSIKEVYRYAENRLIWVVAYPLGWISDTVDKLEQLERYIGRRFSADTDVDVGDDKVDLKFSWKF